MTARIEVIANVLMILLAVMIGSVYLRDRLVGSIGSVNFKDEANARSSGATIFCSTLKKMLA